MSGKIFFLGILGVMFASLVIYGIYKLANFSIFDDEFKVIEQIDIPNKEYSLKIHYIPSNASSQSYIQIRKFEKNVEEVLESYERYNYLNEYEIIGQDTLSLLISDTSRINTEKEVKIKLP
ncbi:MAG: hypothetical protein ACKV1O_16490 [Saprospiraceae bacterium]